MRRNLRPAQVCCASSCFGDEEDRRGVVPDRVTGADGDVEVTGREQLQLPEGTVQTWRVLFTSAGITNTAWYRADDSRTLVKYEITRGPTLILEQANR